MTSCVTSRPLFPQRTQKGESARLREIGRGRIKDLLVKKLHAGLAPNSVRLIYATARALLSSAVDDGVIYANPALKLGHQLRLVA